MPMGFSEKRLALADEQWARIVQGYSTDEKSAYGGLPIKNIYDVGCGTFAGPNMVANDASALLGKMFFTVNVGCNEDMTVLYTIREAVRDVCGELPDATKELVLVAPMDMQVYISKLTAEDAVYDQEEAQEWTKTNTRQDIMWWAHESVAPHPRQETTARRAQSIAWWSTIIEESP